MLHFHPCVQRLQKIISDGTIGRVIHIHCRVGSQITLRNSLSRYQEKFPGALMLDYAHQPDLLFWLLGELPTGVTMSGLQAGNLPHTSNPNVLDFMLDYANPIQATVHLNYIQMPQRHEYEIVGDKGWVVTNLDTGLFRIGLRETEKETTEQLHIERDDMYRAEHAAFLAAIDGKQNVESPGDAAARSVELFEMAMQSWKNHNRVVCHWEKYDL